VHGAGEREAAEAAGRALFGQGDLAEVPGDVIGAALAEVPHATLSATDIEGGLLPDIVDLLTRAGLAASRGAARRTVAEGGAYVNNVRVEAEDYRPAVGDLLQGRYLVLRRGRKTLAGIRLES